MAKVEITCNNCYRTFKTSTRDYSEGTGGAIAGAILGGILGGLISFGGGTAAGAATGASIGASSASKRETCECPYCGAVNRIS